MGPPLCKHCQEHIASVIKYFEAERNNRGPLVPLEQVRQRAADALGLSINSISKVSKKVRSGEPLAGPSKPKRAKTITAVSENQAIEIRNVIYQMHADNGASGGCCIPLVTPNMLMLSSRGRVKLCLTRVYPSVHLELYLAPEYRPNKKYSDTDIEKMWIFALGETLKKATFSSRSSTCRMTSEFCQILTDMTKIQVSTRASLMHLLDVISEYCKVRQQIRPFSHIVMDLHQEAMAAVEDAMETPWGPPAMPQLLPRTRNRSECNENVGTITRHWMNLRHHDIPKLTKEASTSMEDVSTSNFNHTPGTVARPKSMCIPDCSFVDDDFLFERKLKIDNFFKKQEGMNSYFKPPSSPLPHRHRPRRNPVQRAASRLYRASSTESPETIRCVGPEFAIRAALPPKKLIFSGSGRNSKSVTIILLDGQRLEVECEPNRTTAGELLELIIVSEKIEENFMLGLSALIAGDFVFLPSDTRISKAQESTNLPPTLYVRVRFFLSTLRGIRSPYARHLLYLQLRRAVLEHQLPCALTQLLELGGLALQAEFGDFRRREHGARDYFLLEHYIPETMSSMVSDQERLRQELVKVHLTKKGLESEKAEQDFITFAQGLPHYGGHFYTATWMLKDNSDKDIWLYISAHGINLYERAKSSYFGPHLYEMFEWRNIQTLCYSKHYLCILPHNRMHRFTKLKKYKLRMDQKKSYFAFRLASLHHQFFLRLRTEFTSLQSLSKQFGIPIKDIKNETNSLYKLEAFANQIQSSDDGSIDAETEFKIEFRSSKTNVNFGGSNTRLRKSKSAENIQDIIDEESQNKENEHPRNSSLVLDSSCLSGLALGNHVEKRRGVKMGTRMFGNLVSKFSRSMEVVAGSNEYIENMSVQSFASISRSSNGEAYIIDSSLKPCSHALLPNFQETLSQSLLDKLNMMSFAEERNLYTVFIERDENGSLGLQIMEGSDGNVYVQSVIMGGPAHLNENILRGDQIVAVNGNSLLGMRYSQALEFLKKMGNGAEFIIARGTSSKKSTSHHRGKMNISNHIKTLSAYYHELEPYQTCISPVEKHLTENCHDSSNINKHSTKDDLSYHKHIRYEVESEKDDFVLKKTFVSQIFPENIFGRNISKSCTQLNNLGDDRAKIVDMIPKENIDITRFRSLDRRQFKNMKESKEKNNIPPVALPRSLGLSRKWRGPVRYPVTPVKKEENNFEAVNFETENDNNSDEEQVFI